jgi:hypothetical protein
VPKIDTYTAQGRQAVLSLPAVSPDSFGHQAFSQLSEFGRTLQESAEKIRRRQEELDLTEADNTYRVGLDAITTEIAKDPNLDTHGSRFEKEVGALQDRTVKQYPNLSSQAQQVLGGRFSTHNANATIDLAHNVQKVGVGRALASYADMADAQIAKAAISQDPAVAADALNTVDDHRERNVRDGLMDAPHAQKDAESRQHQYWVTFAQHQPQTLLGLPGNGNEVMAMDPSKRQEYRNLAVSTLHTQQAQADQKQKELDAALKARQEINKSTLQADVMSGKPLPLNLSELVRTRELDGDAVAPILALQKTLTEVPNMAKYQRGLATGIETQLSAMKYDNQPFDPSIIDSLQADYVQGHLLKEEFTHLAGIARAVEAHKADAAKTPKNSTIAHAAANLEQVMESANKLTGFSAVGNQATASAKEYFYRRIEQEPNVNPWDVMHDASARFKPIVEKQQGVSKVDQMLLDDAKMDAQVKLKIVSPAAAKAYRETTQGERGRKAVNDALKALPPPPEPGFFERLFKQKEAARKPAGVMGE